MFGTLSLNLLPPAQCGAVLPIALLLPMVLLVLNAAGAADAASCSLRATADCCPLLLLLRFYAAVSLLLVRRIFLADCLCGLGCYPTVVFASSSARSSARCCSLPAWWCRYRLYIVPIFRRTNHVIRHHLACITLVAGSCAHKTRGEAVT